MTDQQGASLERILRDIERRLQKLEAAQRIKEGVTLPQAEYVPHAPSMTAAETAPGTYSSTYATSLRLDIFNLRATVAAEMQALRDSNLQASS
ncbi:hypothetical protein [Nonomuraea sp. NPDC005650]|uniref:hypothetical protein n=1 Tax=Nonomuraea sp. NPDC005650 TaxID=3157045 RepID=UPI0033BA0F6E